LIFPILIEHLQMRTVSGVLDLLQMACVEDIGKVWKTRLDRPGRTEAGLPVLYDRVPGFPDPNCQPSGRRTTGLSNLSFGYLSSIQAAFDLRSIQLDPSDPSTSVIETTLEKLHAFTQAISAFHSFEAGNPEYSDELVAKYLSVRKEIRSKRPPVEKRCDHCDRQVTIRLSRPGQCF
jgi:hypothetical protein